MFARFVNFLVSSSVCIIVGGSGCGGGATGTGGIVGDLHPSQKIQTLEDRQARQFCDNIVSLASNALGEDQVSASTFTVTELIKKYVEPPVYPPSGGELSAPGRLRPIFSSTTPEAFKIECETLLDSALTTVAQQGICYDVSQLPSSLAEALGREGVSDEGACDLRSPRFGEFEITVGEYADCMSDYISSISFSPTSTVNCSAAYEVFQKQDWSNPFVLTQLIPFPMAGPRDLPPACREIQKRVGRSLVPLFPVGCSTGLPGAQAAVAPGFLLTDD